MAARTSRALLAVSLACLLTATAPGFTPAFAAEQPSTPTASGPQSGASGATPGSAPAVSPTDRHASDPHVSPSQPPAVSSGTSPAAPLGADPSPKTDAPAGKLTPGAAGSAPVPAAASEPAKPGQPATVKPVAAVTPTVILVHSELMDASSWRNVIALLDAKGVKSQAVQLPLNSMWADVAVIQRALAIVKGPVILVGHSWGGVIITEAGVDSKVAALVYVAAMAPDIGQSFIDRVRNAPRGPGLARLLTDTSGFVRLADDAFATDFAQDLDPVQNRLLAATQAPVFGKVFEEKVNNAAWKTLPVWYVLAAHDRMLDPAAQQTEAGRINARVTSAPGGHAIPLSQPEAVAQVIMEAVAAVKGGASAGHDGAAQPLQPLPPAAAPK